MQVPERDNAPTLYTGVMRLHFVAFTILRKACDYQNLCGWKTKCHGTEPREVTETEVDGCRR